jgi:hypothetical protein
LPKVGKSGPINSSFKKISQTEYLVEVKNVSLPFVLVFNESFDQGWKIISTDVEAKHLIVNGYANGWYISPEASCAKSACELEFRITYEPQRYFSLTMIINTILFLLASTSLLVVYINKLFRKK